MKNIDQETINRIGIPGIVLMENASRSIFLILKDSLEEGIGTYSFSVFCGKGNNGGDGFGVARYLYNHGAEVTIYSFVDSNSVKGDSKINFDICVKLGIEIVFIEDLIDNLEVAERISNSDITIDAIFGTGFHGDVKNEYLEIINLINEESQYIVSIDIPSGLNGCTGLFSESVFADLTVTLGFVKTGLVIADGPAVCGDIVIGNIGIPEIVVNNSNLQYRYISEIEASHTLPSRFMDSHKGLYGKTAVYAGSRLMTGAPGYVIKALDSMGTGLIYYLVDSETEEIGKHFYEAVKIDTENISELSKIDFDCWILGPGLGTSSETQEKLYQLLEIAKSKSCPVLLDADALNILSKKSLEELDDFFKGFNIPPLLTPHLGEFSRLTKTKIDQIHGNEIKLALEFSSRWNCVVLLKGVTSVIASPGGEVILNMTGNDGLAKGGSGDVLSGISGNLLAQIKDPFIAAYLGSFILGRLAECYSKTRPSRTCSPELLIQKIPEVVGDLENLRENL